MRILEWWYRKFHRGKVPYYYRYSIFTIAWKPLRKFINVVVIPSIPMNTVRVALYRILGFRIGRGAFIGMRCYMDDIDPSMTRIGENVTISYGCFFACHGINQSHTPIEIRDGAYFGMRATILSGAIGIWIGSGAIIGACSLVNKSIPDGATAVGVPVRIIEQRIDRELESDGQATTDARAQNRFSKSIKSRG
jgi:acetyltransferase-like isoleucine patch superfamily enzyme